ncbi:general substrate transporter [Meredithblackwellia eburnea MCA 4105]
MGGRGTIFIPRHAWKSATLRLLFFCAVYSFGSVFFGYDASSFAGVQAFTPYIKQFGTCNSKGVCKLSAKLTSLMNSLPLIGKFIGTLVVGPMTEKLGHKKSMFITCLVQIIGVIVQVTSHRPAQFTAGRIIVYVAVGLVENVVPTFESEIAPAPLRGAFVGSLQLFLTFGSLIAGIVNNSCAKYKDQRGWIIATAIQIIPAFVILLGLYFTTDSPRWLVSKGRHEEAIAVLRKLRHKSDVDMGVCEEEVAALQEAKETTMRKGSWFELFNRKNLRRTGIACAIMSLQQLTGVTFSSSYGPTFYKQVGLGSMAFAYAAINNGVSVVTALLGMLTLDMFGRRSVTFWGCLGQALFLFLIGGIGSKAHRTASETHGMVASFIIYAAILHMTLGPAAYITSAEVGTAALREKTMAFSTAVNVVVSFAVVFTTPYLLSAPYANLGPKLGYVWGGCAAVGAVWVWFCMPELKGRTLEEIDQIFDAKIPAWRFSSFETTGTQAEMSKIAAEGAKVDANLVENSSIDKSQA